MPGYGYAIEDVVDHCLTHHSDDLRTALISELGGRDVAIADIFRLAANQFSLHSEIVEEMFCQTGLGGPYDQEHRERTRAAFVALRERLQAEHDAAHGDDENHNH